MKTATRFLTLALLLALGCSMWAQQGSTPSSTNNNNSDQRPSTPARPRPQPQPQVQPPAPLRPQPQPQVQPPVQVRPQPQTPPTAAVVKNGTPRYVGRSVAESVAEPTPAPQHHHHGEEQPRYYVGYYYPYPQYTPSNQPAPNDPAMNDNNGAYPDAQVEATNGHYEPPSDGYVPSAIPAPPVDAAPPVTPSVDVSQIQTPSAPVTPDNTAILVFKDGHTLEVKGFMIYAGNVIVLTGDVRRIPLALLNLPATTAANNDAGYTFRLPAVYRD